MERLVRLRKLRGFSQRALAKESGVSPATIYELENGRREPNPSTLRKLASALEVEVADLLEEPDIPKGTAPPLQRTLFNGLEEERRETLYGPWLDFANRYADRWEERVKAGDFDLGSVHEFIATVEDLMPTLHRLNADEQRGLPRQPYSFGVPAAKTGVAISRLSDLIDPLITAGASKFENSELEQLRQKRAEQEAALADIARRGA